MPVGGYGFYLTSQKTNETIELPVNPSEIKLKYESDDKSATIINLGEVNQLGITKLVEIEISSSFPENEQAHYVTTNDWKEPQDYIDWIRDIQNNQGKVRFVLSSTKISILTTVSSFEYGYEKGNADEYVYTLTLKQYREFGYDKVKAKKTKSGKTKKTKKKKRSSPAKKIGMGSKVKVNGRLHLDSYGSGPGQYEKNATRIITNIAPGNKYPYHVATVGGGPRGWVKASEVKKA